MRLELKTLNNKLASPLFLLFFLLFLNIRLVDIGADFCNNLERCLTSCVTHHLNTTVYVLDKSGNLILTSVDTLIVNGSELEVITMDLFNSLAYNIKGVEVGVSLFIILPAAYEDLCWTDRR